ncbi:hypothetical protein INN84_16930, partial [Staphylococcus aureus]|nr:hypothetical protein [Staphylococcus aureus]
LTIPMVFGLIAIMPSFYLWFFGEEFASTVPLMTILAILVLIIMIATVKILNALEKIPTCWYVPTKPRTTQEILVYKLSCP